MNRAVVVRYRTRPEHADANERLIRAVFAELDQVGPAGLDYRAVRLDDGVTFVHVAVLPESGNPLNELASFQTFVSGIGERCADGPVPVEGALVGSYAALDDPAPEDDSAPKER